MRPPPGTERCAPDPSAPAACAAPRRELNRSGGAGLTVEAEEGDESGPSVIAISAVKNRGRLGAGSPARLDQAWMVGWLEAPSPFPFAAAAPRRGGTRCRREAAAGGGLGGSAMG